MCPDAAEFAVFARLEATPVRIRFPELLPKETDEFLIVLLGHSEGSKAKGGEVVFVVHG
jgi:hypothetical protein